MTKHEQLALALQSAGACEPSSEEYSLSLIVEEDNDLLIKEYREGDIKQQVFVAEQVRTGTDAPLINLEDQKLIFYASDDDYSRLCLVSSPAEDIFEWNNVGLSKDVSELVLHDESSITAAAGPCGVFAFFQLLDCRVCGLVWAGPDQSAVLKPEDIGVSAVPGSPLSAVEVEGNMHLFYVHTDGNVHCATLGEGEEKWADEVVKNGEIGDDAAKRMIVSHDAEQGGFVAAILTESGKVLLITGGENGSRVQLGTVEDGDFIPATSAECAYCTYVPVYYVAKSRRSRWYNTKYYVYPVPSAGRRPYYAAWY